jgi:acetyltransferase-like isoleucine patch superfamily enzyme
MIKTLISKLVRIARRASWVTYLSNKRRFPGMAISTTVNMNVQGHLIVSQAMVGDWSQIVVPLGARLVLGDGCYVGRNVELGPSGMIRIGTQTSIQDRCIILGDVLIGDHCAFAPNVYVSSGRHHFDGQPWSLIKDQDEKAAAQPDPENVHIRQVVIEDDCWLGINTVVMRGVTIGKGAIVGANSVVTKNVAPYSVVAGAPARELRQRFHFQPPKQISWDVDEHMPYFYSGFQLSQAHRARNAGSRGLVVQHSVFRLALAVEIGRLLGVTVKLSRAAPQVYLRYGDVSHIVSVDFCELTFPMEDDTTLHLLSVDGLPPSGVVSLIIQSARQT